MVCLVWATKIMALWSNTLLTAERLFQLFGVMHHHLPVLQIYFSGFQYIWALSSRKSDVHLTQGCKAMQLGHCAKATERYIYQSSKNPLEDRPH